MTQQQRPPALLLPNNIVRDALAALHLNLPPGREEAMVKLLQAHALNERGASLEEALRHEGDYVRGAMRALGGLLASLNRNTTSLSSLSPNTSTMEMEGGSARKTERGFSCIEVADGDEVGVNKDELDPKKRASSGRFRFFRNFGFPYSRGTPRSSKRVNSSQSPVTSTSECGMTTSDAFSPVSCSIHTAALTPVRPAGTGTDRVLVSGDRQKDGCEDSRMVGGGGKDDDIHAEKLVETREVGCSTASPVQPSSDGSSKDQSYGFTNTSSPERKAVNEKSERPLMISHGFSKLQQRSASAEPGGSPTNDVSISISTSSIGDTNSEKAKVRPGMWRMGHQIGKGSFGSVHIGLNDVTGDLIAVKVLSLSNPHVKIVKSTIEALYREIQLMRNMKHENIIRYLGAELQAENQRICIFQEWVPGSITSLLDNFGPFGERRIAQYTKQILHGLVYLHGEGVMHRDIKGSNILIDDKGVVKLCDFGASKMLHGHDSDQLGIGDHTRVGSPLFMAPEVLLKQDYGQPVDIWSLGGAVLQMKTGTPPWSSLNLKTPVALIQWIRKSENGPPLPEDGDISPALRVFLGRCFIRDPTKRPTALELLSDPFLEEKSEEMSVKIQASSSVSDIELMSPKAAIKAMKRASYSAIKVGSGEGSHASGEARSPTWTAEDDGTKKNSTAMTRHAATPRNRRHEGLYCITDPQKANASSQGVTHHSTTSPSYSSRPVTPVNNMGTKYTYGGRRTSDAFGSPTVSARDMLSPTGEMCFTPDGRHSNPYSCRKRSVSVPEKETPDNSTDSNAQLGSTSCRATPIRSASHYNTSTTHGIVGRENQDAVTGAPSPITAMREDVDSKNKKDGGSGGSFFKLVDPHRPKDILIGKTEESLAASDRLASPVLAPPGTGNIQDENTNGMTRELQLEPRKLYTNQSNVLPPTPPQPPLQHGRVGGPPRMKQHNTLGQKNFNSVDRRKSLDHQDNNTLPKCNSSAVNLLPRGSPSTLRSSRSEASMCPIDRLSSPPDLSGTGSRRNSRESRRGSKDSQRSSRRDSTNSECENMFLSLAVEECLAMSGGN